MSRARFGEPFPEGRYKVLLDGVPMTREALVKALLDRYPQYRDVHHAVGSEAWHEFRRLSSTFEFDVAERLFMSYAMRLHNWCHEQGIETEVGHR